MSKGIEEDSWARSRERDDAPTRGALTEWGMGWGGVGITSSGTSMITGTSGGSTEDETFHDVFLPLEGRGGSGMELLRIGADTARR